MDQKRMVVLTLSTSWKNTVGGIKPFTQTLFTDTPYKSGCPTV